MAYVYRYVDKNDGIIKYVGIVFGKTRTLKQRIKEHEKDVWYQSGDWKIEYITEQIDSRSEAEAFESHYISLFGTDRFFNKAKVGWGINKYLPDRTSDFVEYVDDKENDLSESDLQNFEIHDYSEYGTMSVELASKYFNIDKSKIIQIVNSNPNADFALCFNNCLLIRRKQFERYISKLSYI